MDLESALDALQADVIAGTGGADALEVLGETLDVAPRQLLVDLLERAPRERRWLAAEAMRYLQADDELLDLLKETATDYGSTFHARQSALETLSALDPERGRRAAVEILRDPDNGLEMRDLAGDVLAGYPAERITADLESAMDDHSTSSRKIAADVAGRAGCAELRHRLEELAEHDPDERVRDAASLSLERLAVSAAG